MIDFIDMRIGHRSEWYEAPSKDTHHYYLGQRFPGLNTTGTPLEVNSLTEYGQSSYKEQYRTYHMKVHKELASASKKMTPAENEYANKTMALLLSHLEYGTLRKSWDIKKQHNEDRGGYSEQDEKDIMTRYYDNAKSFSEYVSPETAGSAIANFLGKTPLHALRERMLTIRFGLQNDQVKSLNETIGRILVNQKPLNRKK